MLLGLLAFNTQAQNSQNSPTVKGSNQFALELYKKLSSNPQKNVFVSPYSISSALAMTYAGAKGSTAQEIANALHLPKNSVHQDFKNLNTHLNQLNTKGLQLSVANALWSEKSQKFLKAYLGLTQSCYRAKVKRLDFKQQPEKSRLIINKWVEDKTQRKIKNLIPKGIINQTTRLVLTNAIYFKGQWKYKFKKSQTRKMDFIAGKQKISDVKFMQMQRKFKYAETESLQVIELPYASQKVSMVVLLPKDINGIAKLEASLTAESYQKLMDRLFYTQVKLSLPKFKMTLNVKLKNVLKTMGMQQAFGNTADFSGMTGNKSLKISEVVHKAFVEVSEKGTEAAAATAVVVRTKSASAHRPVKPKVFRADHPFIFMIKDNTTGSILFMGKLANPK
ncbi:scca2/scca1 fusion protein isoform 1 [Microscilla marina ATCC 23134]|uniref:Scca2/scca1 fusion protein isoform 1 n=2 Tax=Microscilla marina TaxID=1027 RepID=A1ZEB9_MICM2|nr:scca2/scca1 fusion protein isoform 1 [Microscilla marina ATCC 23134]